MWITGVCDTKIATETCCMNIMSSQEVHNQDTFQSIVPHKIARCLLTSNLKPCHLQVNCKTEQPLQPKIATQKI